MTGLIARTCDQAQAQAMATYLRQAGLEVLKDEVTWQARTREQPRYPRSCCT